MILILVYHSLAIVIEQNLLRDIFFNCVACTSLCRLFMASAALSDKICN